MCPSASLTGSEEFIQLKSYVRGKKRESLGLCAVLNALLVGAGMYLKACSCRDNTLTEHDKRFYASGVLKK